MPPHSPRADGAIEVICGSMFSGKTEELIRRLRRAEIARLKTAIFKPRLDHRFSPDQIVSHARAALQAVPVASSAELPPLCRDAEVIAIDEAQFFDEGLVDVCRSLAQQGKRVIVAGLEKDFRGQPFGAMPQLLCEADYVDKLQAICVRCGAPASFSRRLSASKEQILIGEKDSYEACCRRCYAVD